MPTKNIYVRDSDAVLWQKAEELAGGSVSSLITEALRSYVQELELKEQTEMETIKVELSAREGYGWEEDAYDAQFMGQWLLAPDPDETRTGETGYDGGTYYGVAYTQRGNIAVYTRHCNDRFAPRLTWHSSLYEAGKVGYPADILARAAASPMESEIGADYVRKLDI